MASLIAAGAIAGATSSAGAATASAIATASTVASIASAAVGAVGALASANAQSNAAKANAAIASRNAQQAQNNASLAAASGDQQAGIEQQKTRAQVGAIKAAEGASGVDVDSGSALQVQSSAAQLGELNAISIRSNAARVAYGYQTQAAGFQDESQLQNQEASYDTTAGAISGASTFLGGAARAGLGYEQYLTQAGRGLGSVSSAAPVPTQEPVSVPVSYPS